MGDIEVTFEEAKDAFREAVLGRQIFRCDVSTRPRHGASRRTFVTRGDFEEGPQRVVDGFVCFAARRHNVV